MALRCSHRDRWHVRQDLDPIDLPARSTQKNTKAILDEDNVASVEAHIQVQLPCEPGAHVRRRALDAAIATIHLEPAHGRHVLLEETLRCVEWLARLIRRAQRPNLEYTIGVDTEERMIIEELEPHDAHMARVHFERITMRGRVLPEMEEAWLQSPDPHSVRTYSHRKSAALWAVGEVESL